MTTPDPVTTAQVDQWTRRLWHTACHSRMPLVFWERISRVANEMRETAGLRPFTWMTDGALPDAEFGECSFCWDGCEGQDTHGA